MPGLKTTWVSFDADWNAVRDICVTDPACCGKLVGQAIGCPGNVFDIYDAATLTVTGAEGNCGLPGIKAALTAMCAGQAIPPSGGIPNASFPLVLTSFDPNAGFGQTVAAYNSPNSSDPLVQPTFASGSFDFTYNLTTGIPVCTTYPSITIYTPGNPNAGQLYGPTVYNIRATAFANFLCVSNSPTQGPPYFIAASLGISVVLVWPNLRDKDGLFIGVGVTPWADGFFTPLPCVPVQTYPVAPSLDCIEVYTAAPGCICSGLALEFNV